MAKMNKAQADKILHQVYSDYSSLLIKYCTVRLKEVPDAVDDCIQNTYLVYYKRLLTGEDIKSPKAFLYRTADNMVKRAIADFYKNAKRHTDLEEAERVITYDDFENNINTELDYDRLKELLISQLNESEQKLYQLKYAEGKSLKEIGEQLNIAPSAVANRTSRLRNKIKLLIDETIEAQTKGGKTS